MTNHMFIAGSFALALAAGSMLLPSVSEAAARHGGGGGGAHRGGHSVGRVGGLRAGGYRRSGGGYNGGGWDGGYYAYCGPIQLALGLCGGY